MSADEPKKNDVKARALWLLADACVFGLTLYKGIEYTLLYADNVIGVARLALWLAGVFGVMAALRAGWVRRFGGRIFPSLIIEIAACGAFMYALFALSGVQRKTQSFTWLALEWHKLLDNHWLLVRITPWFALLLAAAAAGSIWLVAARRRAWLLIALASTIALTMHQCLIMAKKGTLGIYIVMYVMPLVAAALAGAFRQQRAAARAIVLAAASLILLWHYIGWAPVTLDTGFARMSGVEKIYPRQGREPEFPLGFFRDFQVDDAQRYLFTAYGPTSGMIRLDLKTGGLKIIKTTDELVRYIDLVPERREFFALDWMSQDMLTMSMDTMKILRRENVCFDKKQMYVPLFFMDRGDRMYATYSERPGVAEYALRPLRLRRSINFRRSGLTRFRSGVWKAAIDPKRDKLFVELGMTDLRDRFLIARIDLKTFKVDGTAELPEGGLELTAIPEKRRIIATSFFSDKLYEFDMDTMKQTRVLRGPVSCRNLVYDSRRNLLIGTGFLNGDFRIIDFQTERTLVRARVGNKAASLFLTPGGDTLYLGSARGIFRVDMERFLESTRAAHVH